VIERTEVVRELAPRPPSASTEGPARALPTVRTVPTVQIGTVEIEVIAPPAPAPMVASTPSRPAATAPLSRGLTSSIGLRQS
jgi:hypothetical protein